jgi:hypothetical protein
MASPVRSSAAVDNSSQPLVDPGLTRPEIRRLVQSGVWTWIRRGSYVETVRWEAAHANTRHRLLVRATVLLGERAAVDCERSAVPWYRLDTLSRPPAAGHVRVSTGSGGGAAAWWRAKEP